MRNLAHKKSRFLSVASNYADLYTYSNSSEQLVISAGVLNFIWNQWNNFWRDYWLSHVCGGIYFDKSILTPIHAGYNDKQGCHYLLYACGRRNNHNYGASISGNYQEVSWGDPNKMANIIATIQPHHSHLSYCQSLLGVYQRQIQHFQKIRNSFIHLNNENIYYLNSIASYYIFRPEQQIIDILEAKDMSSSVRCFDYLVDSMTGMIKNL